jgi:hypothetical protein
VAQASRLCVVAAAFQPVSRFRADPARHAKSLY